MADEPTRSRGDHYLSRRITVRFSPNEMEWIRAQARGMSPPVSESYIVRGCVVGFRQITSRPLIENLKPLADPPDGGGQAPTTPQVRRRRR
ncbi:MAG: hypothetical protein IVW52_04860 [Acidimicrobiales bacterium]|nr:hypothetical protein [Acidimicrobiales bacterium]